MGLFDDQLKTRLEQDRESFADALEALGESVTGKAAVTGKNGSLEDAVHEILTWFGVKAPEPPGLMDDFNDRLDYMLNPTGIRRRTVKLDGTWWRKAAGPMLAYTAEGGAVALLPRRFGGYAWRDPANRRTVRASVKTTGILTGEAVCFYRPLPLRALTLRDLFLFAVQSVDRWDLTLFLLAGLLASLFGTAVPFVTQILFATVIPMGGMENLAPVGMLAVGALFSLALVGLTKSLAVDRIAQKVRLAVENAAMSRLLSLPAQFFRTHNAGELQNRVDALTQMCALLGDTVLTGVINGVFSIVYLFLIRALAPALFGPTTVILLAQLMVMIAGVLAKAHVARKRLHIAADLNGLVFRLFSGIQKIKLAGAEQRAFSKWARCYAENAALLYNPPLLLRIQPVLSALIALGGSILLYSSAAKSGMQTADYMAFASAYGLVNGAMLSLASMTEGLAALRPLAELAEPIMKAVPETGGNKKQIHRMSGGVELANLSFRYAHDAPWILDHINLKIRPGQYVAIVGKTGCGKSTLMRLLLGFETPVSGAVYYDNRDLQTLDLPALRRNIGVVLQQSRLFAGDIYSNIAISAPWLTMDEAWEAAKLAGMDEDIKKMPMGMYTLIGEGGGALSGGQRQRLMIARAIASKPKILMFDEATSALDNITQRIVSDSLGQLRCTRIVIAHRLSTIRQCDRILVLDGGKIVEDGAYDELITAKGLFAELVRRQTLDMAPL